MNIETAIHCMKVTTDECVCEECFDYGDIGTDHCEKDAARLAITALEAMDNLRWIPVSERLPQVEKDTWYWCTCYAPHRGYFTQPAQWWPAIGEFLKPSYKGEVIAWMEKMPRPYVPKN